MKRLYCFLVVMIAGVFAFGASLAEPVPTQQLYGLLEQHGVSYVRSFESGDGGHEWQLVVHKGQGEALLSVFDRARGELIYRYAEPDLSDRFIREEIIELSQYSGPLIGTTWQRGVHGEQFVLIDPIKKTIVYRVTSAWPLTTHVCGNYILVTVSTYSDDEEMPLEKTHQWNGLGKVIIHQGEVKGC